MGAAYEIRAGKRAKFQALEEAGLNNHVVDLFIFVSSSGGKDYAGKQGERRYNKLTLKPNPEVTLTRREIMTQDGFVTASDAQLKGAFPDTLNGLEVVMNGDGEVTASSPISKTYTDARDFRVDIEKTDFILIDGERYAFRAGASLNVDKTESEWAMKLVKADKK